MVDVNRKMPRQVDLGRAAMFPLGHAMYQWEKWKESPKRENPVGHRTVMGFALPTWQRGFVWTEAQSIAFIESAWRGIPLGTYTYNRSELKSPFDNLLVDGQQRMHAIELYASDAFPVFGYRWSEITQVDRRFWDSIHFHAYITETEDEGYLRNYYDLLNFGGTAHRESERSNPTGGAL